jgi:hypothetical protein
MGLLIEAAGHFAASRAADNTRDVHTGDFDGWEERFNHGDPARRSRNQRWNAY